MKETLLSRNNGWENASENSRKYKSIVKTHAADRVGSKLLATESTTKTEKDNEKQSCAKQAC